MILEVLVAEEPAVFRQELFNTLVHYYEEILGLPGAEGRPKPPELQVQDEKCPVACCCCCGRWWRLR